MSGTTRKSRFIVTLIPTFLAVGLLLTITHSVRTSSGKGGGSGTFALTGGMNTAPRARFSLVLLNTGEALAVGGVVDTSAGNATASAEVFNPAQGSNGKWKVTGSMSNTACEWRRVRWIRILHARERYLDQYGANSARVCGGGRPAYGNAADQRQCAHDGFYSGL